jgi:hypothetical protein
LQYRVVFLGLSEKEDAFKAGMEHFGITTSIAEEIIQKAPVVLKGGLTLSAAQRYGAAVKKAGGRVVIQSYRNSGIPSVRHPRASIEPMENFTMCPECGYKQHKTPHCLRCGSAL